MAECVFVSEVEGADRWNGGLAGQGVAERNADIVLRNNAAKLGANTVLLSS